jgi:hypothetical protein
MTISRISAALVALVLLMTVAVAPVAAHHNQGDGVRSLPTQINLPDGFQPEGITSSGRNLYTGSLANGAIYKANAKTGAGRIIVPGVAGRLAVGLHIDRWGRLWVAGGPNQTIRVYKARTGKLLRTYTFPTAGFVNDLVITRKAVYATDSFNAQLLVVPLRHGGRLAPASAAKTKALTGDIVVVPGEFNANGIVERSGRLILVQSNAGLLFRVNERTGVATKIDTGGYSLANGDGLTLRGGRLYVANNNLNLIAVLNLSRNSLRARLDGEIKSAGLEQPTGVNVALGALWAVNARFATPATPTTPYWITRLPLRP